MSELVPRLCQLAAARVGESGRSRQGLARAVGHPQGDAGGGDGEALGHVVCGCPCGVASLGSDDRAGAGGEERDGRALLARRAAHVGGVGAERDRKAGGRRGAHHKRGVRVRTVRDRGEGDRLGDPSGRVRREGPGGRRRREHRQQGVAVANDHPLGDTWVRVRTAGWAADAGGHFDAVAEDAQIASGRGGRDDGCVQAEPKTQRANGRRRGGGDEDLLTDQSVAGRRRPARGLLPHGDDTERAAEGHVRLDRIEARGAVAFCAVGGQRPVGRERAGHRAFAKVVRRRQVRIGEGEDATPAGIDSRDVLEAGYRERSARTGRSEGPAELPGVVATPCDQRAVGAHRIGVGVVGGDLHDVVERAGTTVGRDDRDDARLGRGIAGAELPDRVLAQGGDRAVTAQHEGVVAPNRHVHRVVDPGDHRRGRLQGVGPWVDAPGEHRAVHPDGGVPFPVAGGVHGNDAGRDHDRGSAVRRGAVPQRPVGVRPPGEEPTVAGKRKEAFSRPGDIDYVVEASNGLRRRAGVGGAVSEITVEVRAPRPELAVVVEQRIGVRTVLDHRGRWRQARQQVRHRIVDVGAVGVVVAAPDPHAARFVGGDGSESTEVGPSHHGRLQEPVGRHALVGNAVAEA